MSTPASTRSSWHRTVRPEPPAAFSALQTTRWIPHRWIRRGRTWPTILRPGDPTTSPMKRILRGIDRSFGEMKCGGPGPSPTRGEGGRPALARSPGEFYGPGLAQDSHLDLAGIDELFLDGAGDVAAELGGLVVVELVAVGD